MVQLTMQVPDELAKRIQPIGSWLPTVIELSLIGFKTLAAATAAETIQFLSKNPDPQEVLDYHVSEKAQERLQRLLTLNQAGLLSEMEQLELDELQQIEHIVIMLKAQVTSQLKQGVKVPSDLSASVRQFVVRRAGNRCEYCLLPQSFSLHKHEPDHIVPRQHGGNTAERNLALSCMYCNRYKGPNVGSFDPQTGTLVPFFNPRTQDGDRHFELEKGVIRALTAEARVTVKILRFNDEKRIAERQHLIELGLYQ